MPRVLRLFSFLLTLCTIAAPAWAQETTINVGKAPVVVELYTSQGCVSCPEADRILGQLSHHPRLFTLSCHVTYWDYLGWKDTLGSQKCTNRQMAYMKTKGKGNYYTPQMIVNGGPDFPGHNAPAIKDQIEQAAQQPVKPISLSSQGKSLIIASLPQIYGNDPYMIWVIGYINHYAEKVDRGENKGKELSSTNAVRMIESGGHWNGQAALKRYELGKTDDLDGIVIIAQKNAYGPIVAAGRLEF